MTTQEISRTTNKRTMIEIYEYLNNKYRRVTTWFCGDGLLTYSEGKIKMDKLIITKNRISGNIISIKLPYNRSTNTKALLRTLKEESE